MTSTNQAFIKAYRKDDAQPEPASPAIAGAARPAAVEQVAIAAGERSALYGPRATDTSRPMTEAASEKRPLSSFIAATGIARLSTEPAEADFFRPGTTVASFHWPAVCRTLLRQCGDQFGRVADLLVDHGSAGRSLIAVIGLLPGRGATTMALCMAARLAARRRRIILVDANFHHPALAAVLEAEPTVGWQDVLMRGSPLPDAAIRAADDRLDVLALGPTAPGNPMRLVSGLQAVVTAGVLRHAYDHVLVDAGAFLDRQSQPILLELVRNMGVDAVIAVTGPDAADPGDLTTLTNHLARSGCEFLGTIENRVA